MHGSFPANFQIMYMALFSLLFCIHALGALASPLGTYYSTHDSQERTLKAPHKLGVSSLGYPAPGSIYKKKNEMRKLIRGKPNRHPLIYEDSIGDLLRSLLGSKNVKEHPFWDELKLVYENIERSYGQKPDLTKLNELSLGWKGKFQLSAPFRADFLDSSADSFIPHSGPGFIDNWVGVNLDLSLLLPTFNFLDKRFGPLKNRPEAVLWLSF